MYDRIEWSSYGQVNSRPVIHEETVEDQYNSKNFVQLSNKYFKD